MELDPDYVLDMLDRCSLVPRPFLPPVFDCMLCGKTEGEEGRKSHVCDVRVDRGGHDRSL